MNRILEFIGLGVLLYLGVTFGTIAADAPPSLKLQTAGASALFQVQLTGTQGATYVIETSTNLASWQELWTTELTNGSALLPYDGSKIKKALFFRAYESNGPASDNLQFRLSAAASIQSLVTPQDGGEAEILTPDLRHIRLTIPAGCVPRAQLFRMTLITNVVGLPFSQGTFGAVQLEPESLALYGAAALEIDFPDGADARQVISFGAANDGSGFGLTLDRFLTNRVLISITQFGSYGACLAPASEVTEILSAPGGTQASEKGRLRIQSNCVVPRSNQSDITSYSAVKDCFPQLVERANAVRADLDRLIYCEFMRPATEQLARAKQLQSLGENDDITPAVVEGALTNMCAIYKEKISPLWAEAQNNCALANVLIQQMLGFERQVEILGATLADCSVSITDYLELACNGGHECMREIAECCRQGRKGGGRLNEGLAVHRTFQILGHDCFGDDDFSDPDLKIIIQDCLTNSWYGTFTLTVSGKYQTSTNRAIGTIGEITSGETHTFDMQIADGLVYGSLEDVIVDTGSDFLDVLISGSGWAKEHDFQFSDSQYTCPPETLPIFKSSLHASHTESHFDTVGLTNFFGTVITNDISTNIVAHYDMSFVLKTNKTYEVSLNGSALQLSAYSVSSTLSTSELCPGTKPAPNNPAPVTGAKPYFFPGFLFNTVKEFPMPDTNTLKGSLSVTRTNLSATLTTLPPSVALNAQFNWTIMRNTNGLAGSQGQ